MTQAGVLIPFRYGKIPAADGRGIGDRAAKLLAQIVYLTRRFPAGFAYSIEQMSDELDMTRSHLEAARRKLAAAGYIEEWKADFCNLLHFKANIEHVETGYAAVCGFSCKRKTRNEDTTSAPVREKPAKPERPNPAKPVSENPANGSQDLGKRSAENLQTPVSIYGLEESKESKESQTQDSPKGREACSVGESSVLTHPKRDADADFWRTMTDRFGEVAVATIRASVAAKAARGEPVSNVYEYVHAALQRASSLSPAPPPQPAPPPKPRPVARPIRTAEQIQAALEAEEQERCRSLSVFKTVRQATREKLREADRADSLNKRVTSLLDPPREPQDIFQAEIAVIATRKGISPTQVNAP